MKFNKENFKKEVKELLEKKGKSHLLEFVEDIAEVCFDVVKVAAKNTEDFALDDMIVATLEPMVDKMIDGIYKGDNE
jgi:hypothetical protein